MLKKPVLAFVAILLTICSHSLSGQQATSADVSRLNQAIRKKEFAKAAHYAYELGTHAHSTGKLDEAKKYLVQSLTYAKRSNNAHQSYLATAQLGNIYAESEDFNNAADYFNRSATLARELKMLEYAIDNHILEAQSFAAVKRFKKALDPLEQALQIALELRSIPIQIRCYTLLKEYYDKSGNQRKALETSNLLETLTTLQENEALAAKKASQLEEQAEQAIREKNERENILITQTAKLKVTEESLKVVEEISAKKQLEIDLLSKERELSQVRIQEQNAKLETEVLFRNSILIVILLGFSLVGVMVAHYRKQIRTNKKIDLQNKNIKSSINYAKRIQEAMLPKKDVQQCLFKESFILFKPRDVVSGDFYWFSALKQAENSDLVFAAIDCTGHGVPGAFMSMIGINSLNNILNQGITESNAILENLHGRIRNALQQDVSGNNDGMDLSLCIYRKQKNILEFSGAKSPLVYIQDNELFHIKGDIHSIGGSRSRADLTFRKHEVSIDKPTIVYLFTDGFRDQFGGEDNQKFMSKRFSKLLRDIHHLPLEEQLDTLNQTFENWKGQGEQTDDVLVIGVRLDPAH